MLRKEKDSYTESILRLYTLDAVSFIRIFWKDVLGTRSFNIRNLPRSSKTKVLSLGERITRVAICTLKDNIIDPFRVDLVCRLNISKQYTESSIFIPILEHNFYIDTRKDILEYLSITKKHVIRIPVQSNYYFHTKKASASRGVTYTF